MKKMLGMREKIFILLTLFITSVLCLVRFIIAFSRECDLIKDLSGREYIDEYLNFSAINYIKVIMIVLICLSALLLLCSFLYLFVKNINIKKGILMVGWSIVLFAVAFFFVSRFMCEDSYSNTIWFTENFERELLCEFGEVYHKNAIYLIFSLMISIVMHFIAFSLSNDYLKDVNAELYNEKNENDTNGSSEEEKALNEEINKLKAKIKIKDLESEYLKLKSRLEE